MSEGGLTLAQIVQQLDGYDDELMIWARARTDLADLTPDSEAVVAPQLEDDGVWWAERGLSYCMCSRWNWPRRPSRSGASGVSARRSQRRAAGVASALESPRGAA